MKKIFILTLFILHLISLKCQQTTPIWNGISDWQNRDNENSGLFKNPSAEFIIYDGFKASGPNYVLSEILNKQHIPFIDSTFYISYSMPYRINFVKLSDNKIKLYIDTMKIKLKFENGYCVSRNIKYSTINHSIQSINYYENTESYFYKKFGLYKYNQRMDSISVLLTHEMTGIGMLNFNKVTIHNYIKFNYTESDSLLYKRKGINYSFSKLSSVAASHYSENEQICVYHLSQYSMGLNQGLIYLFDPIHKWPENEKKYYNDVSGVWSKYNARRDRSFENKYIGLNFTSDSQFVVQRSVYFSNSISNTFFLPEAENYDVRRNKKITISSYYLRPYTVATILNDSTEVLENSETDILYTKEKKLSSIKSKTDYQFESGTQTSKTKSTINFISPYNIVETYYLKEGKSTKKFKINYIISR